MDEADGVQVFARWSETLQRELCTLATAAKGPAVRQGSLDVSSSDVQDDLVRLVVCEQ